MSARAAQRKAQGSLSSGGLPFATLCGGALMLMRHPGHWLIRSQFSLGTCMEFQGSPTGVSVPHTDQELEANQKMVRLQVIVAHTHLQPILMRHI